MFVYGWVGWVAGVWLGCGCGFVVLLERSEFLIATSPKEVCACVRVILVLVLGRQTVYGQKTVYLCLSTYIVFENTHTHGNVRVTTAASETEGVAAVSWMESWIESCV